MERDTLKRKQVRVNLDATAEKHLAKVVGNLKTLSETAIITEILASALATIAEDGYRIVLPLRFSVQSEEKANYLNDGKKRL